jgi:hypothetical protein
MTFKKLLTEQSTYLWRVLVLILIGVLGFYGGRLYARVDKNQDLINKVAIEAITQADITPIVTDIRELRGEIRELNCFLRNEATAEKRRNK